MLAWAPSIEASSGTRIRDRLNRALHVIALVRARYDTATRAYLERRRAEGKTDRETRRRLKHYIARQPLTGLTND